MKTFSLFAFAFSFALCAAGADARRIDFEHHYASTNYINHCATRTEIPRYDPETQVLYCSEFVKAEMGTPMFSTNTLYTDLTDLGEKRIAEMDRAGIDVAVLSSTWPVDAFDPEDAIRVAKLSNDDVYEATKRYPDRFMGTALLPTLQIEAATNELERCVKELGFKYWHAQSHMTGPDGKVRYIWEPEFEPILAKAAELNVSIYLHPDYPTDADYWDSGLAYAGPGLGFGQEVMQTVTHLIMNGTFDRYPNLRVILGHMGEYLPYVLDRMNYHLNLGRPGGGLSDGDGNITCAETLYHYVVTNANIIVSTSGSADTNAFLCAKEALGADRIVFGSDWPYENYTNSTAFIDTCELTDAEKAGVWSENAAKYIFHDAAFVRLGVVAQRYPWNGVLDIEYKTMYVNEVTFKANGIVIGKAPGTGGKAATASFDLNTVAEGAFKNKQLKDVKITATVE